MNSVARVASAIMFIGMASPANIARSADDILQEIRDQVRVLLPRPGVHRAVDHLRAAE